MKKKIAIILFIILGSVWLCMPKIDERAVIQNLDQNITTSLVEPLNEPLEVSTEEPEPDIPALIRSMATESGVDPDKALNIAYCESKFDPIAKNPNSSASGVYQFLSQTWEFYCEGDVFNSEDNIKCFLKLYPYFSHWWECKG